MTLSSSRSAASVLLLPHPYCLPAACRVYPLPSGGEGIAFVCLCFAVHVCHCIAGVYCAAKGCSYTRAACTSFRPDSVWDTVCGCKSTACPCNAAACGASSSYLHPIGPSCSPADLVSRESRVPIWVIEDQHSKPIPNGLCCSGLSVSLRHTLLHIPYCGVRCLLFECAAPSLSQAVTPSSDGCGGVS